MINIIKTGIALGMLLFISSSAMAAYSNGGIGYHKGILVGIHYTALKRSEVSRASMVFVEGRASKGKCGKSYSGVLRGHTYVVWKWRVCKGYNYGSARHFAVVKRNRYTLDKSYVSRNIK